MLSSDKKFILASRQVFFLLLPHIIKCSMPLIALTVNDWHVHIAVDFILSSTVSFTRRFRRWTTEEKEEVGRWSWVEKKIFDNWSTKEKLKLKVKFSIGLGNWAVEHQQPLKAYYRSMLRARDEMKIYIENSSFFSFLWNRRKIEKRRKVVSAVGADNRVRIHFSSL